MSLSHQTTPRETSAPAAPVKVDAPVLGVYPKAAWEERRRLFEAIERVYPVRIMGFDDSPEADLAAAVHFRDDDVLAWDGRSIPTLSIPAGLARLDAPVDHTIDLEFHPQVDDLFHGRAIRERTGLHWSPIDVRPGDQILARSEADPVWVWRLEEKWNVFISAAPLPELEEGERLVDRFRAGCFLGLLPLLQLVKAVLLRSGWQESPLRAAMVVDGPNLQSERYGRLSLADLAQNADQYDFHVSIGMHPVDSWRVDSGAVDLFRTKRKQLSLHFCGPDKPPKGDGHTALAPTPDILGEPQDVLNEAACAARLALAWKRIDRFEAKSLIPVSRVMSPESGINTIAEARMMRRLGFEAVCYDQPAQWMDDDRDHWTTVGALPADLVAGGLPALGTTDASADKKELLFRAFWGQPLLVRHRMTDLASGFENLSQWATFINSLGEVRWMPIEDLSQANYQRGIRRDTLLIRMFGRKARVHVPTMTSHLDLHLPLAQGGWRAASIQAGNETLDLTSGGDRGLVAHGPITKGSELTLVPCDDEALDPSAVTTPKQDPLGVARALWRSFCERMRLFLPFP